MKRGLTLFCLLSLAGCGGGSSSISPPPGGNSGGLAASFFGMTIGDAASYPPANVPIGAIGHPTRLAWGNIEVSKGSYQWNFYDTFVGRAFNHGLPFMMTFGSTPSWALANQSSCIGTICTDPPDNIQDWIDFVTAVVNHYNGVQAPHIKSTNFGMKPTKAHFGQAVRPNWSVWRRPLIQSFTRILQLCC